MKVNHGVTLCLFLWFNFPVNIFSISSGRNNRVLYTEQYYEELMCLALGQNDSEDLDLESDALPVGHAPPLGELLTIMKNGTHCQLDVHC